MSKPVKELLRKELVSRFQGVTSLAVVSLTGVDAVANNRIRGRLLEKDIRVTVVNNALARRAFKDMDLAQAAEMLNGPCAVVYGADSVVTVVRELLDIGKETPNLTVKAALLEGEIFDGQRIVELSMFPNRDEAIAQAVQCALTPGAKLAGCVVGSGSLVAALLKAIEEKHADSGEVAEAPAAEA